MNWLELFRLGKMPLGEALSCYLEESGAPPELVEAYYTALTRYQDGKVKDLAEPFGVAMTQRQKNVLKKRVRDRRIFETVESCANGWTRAIVRDRAIVKEEVDDPLPKAPTENPEKFKERGETAFCRAGKLLRMSAETVKREYYRIRKEHRK